MKVKTVLTFLVLGGLTVAGIFFFRGDSSDESETAPSSNRQQPPAVEVMTARKETVSLSLELTGSVEPYRVARLASPAEGPVHNLRVREGDRVKAGDVLLSIGRKEGIDALIASLREELKKEEDNLRRTRELVESEALPGEQLDQAEAAYEKIRAELVKAQETARDYSITAPWNGVVSRVLVRDGEFVAPRAAVLEMYDPSSLVIRAAVPEKHAANVAMDMQVDVRLDAYSGSGDNLKGRIERVYPYLDTRLRTRTIEITLDDPLDLLPGMFARLKLLLKTVDDAVVVPVEAIVMTPKGQKVFVLRDGKAIARSVEIGIEEENRTQLVAGIELGDKVIIAGNEKLKDGAAVRLSKNGNADNTKKGDGAEPPAGEKSKARGDRQGK